MKKIFSMGFILMAVISAHGQKMSETQISPDLKAKVKTLYPEVTHIIWTKEKSNYEAEFKNKGVLTSILLDSKAKLMEKEIGIPPSTLPAPIIAALKIKFPGKKASEAAIIYKKGVKSYEAEFDGMDYMYTSDGKFLEAVKD